MILINIVAITAFSVLIPFIYVKVVSGFVNRVLGKLISPDFSISSKKMFNLYIGYLIGCLLIAYIIHQVFKTNLVNINKESIPFVLSITALAFCFIVRIITRIRGNTAGKQYLSAVSAFASVLFLINTFSSISSNMNESNLFAYFSLNTLIGLYSSLIDRISSTILFLESSLDYILIGSFATSIIGEKILLHHPSPSRPFNVILEKLHSDFVTYSDSEINKKLDEITKVGKDIKSIRIITRKLTMFESVHSNLVTHINNNAEVKLISPGHYVGNDRKKSPIGKLIRIIFNNRLKILVEGDISSWENRERKLSSILLNKNVKSKTYDLGQLRMIIINESEAMIITTCGKHNGEKCGLYTKEPFIIHSLIMYFESAFNGDAIPIRGLAPFLDDAR